MTIKDKKNKLIAGWREWGQLPQLGIEGIKVKIDTGAKTSSLHAFELFPFIHEKKHWIQFDIHPIQDNDTIIHRCISPIIDYRWITSSTGHKQQRYIIRTLLKIGEFTSTIEISLANRDEMGFRFLVGRDSIKGHLLVDAAHSFILTPKVFLTQ